MTEHSELCIMLFPCPVYRISSEMILWQIKTAPREDVSGMLACLPLKGERGFTTGFLDNPAPFRLQVMTWEAAQFAWERLRYLLEQHSFCAAQGVLISNREL